MTNRTIRKNKLRLTINSFDDASELMAAILLKENEDNLAREGLGEVEYMRRNTINQRHKRRVKQLMELFEANANSLDFAG